MRLHGWWITSLWIKQKWWSWHKQKKQQQKDLHLDFGVKTLQVCERAFLTFQINNSFQLVIDIRHKTMMMTRMVMMSASVLGIPLYLCCSDTQPLACQHAGDVGMRKKGPDWLPQDSSWWRHWRWRQAAVEPSWIDFTQKPKSRPVVPAIRMQNEDLFLAFIAGAE